MRCMMRCTIWLNFDGQYLHLHSSSQNMLNTNSSTFATGQRWYPGPQQRLVPICFVWGAYIQLYAEMPNVRFLYGGTKDKGVIFLQLSWHNREVVYP